MKKLISFLWLLLPLGVGAESTIVGNLRGLSNADNSIMIGDTEAQDLSNVDITDNGFGIKKRDGYSLFKTVSSSTWGIRGGYYFRDTTATDCIVHTNNRSVYVSKNGGNYSAIVTTDTEGSYYDFTDSNGYLWRANSNRDEIFKYSGSAVTYYPSHPKGNQIEALPDRLVISGTSANPNRINFSATADFTDFATGILETSAFTEDIGMPGQNVTALKYAFGQLLIWTKDTMVTWSGSNQFDGVIEDISATIGTTNPNSVIYDQGIVSFQAQDGHFYQYDGNTLQKISDKITGSVTDFARGAARSWSQTTQEDFESGTLTSDVSATINPGSVVLSTWTDTDTSDSDFGLGTLIGASTRIVSGAIHFSTNISNNSFEYNSGTTDVYDWDFISTPGIGSTLLPKDGSRSMAVLDGAYWRDWITGGNSSKGMVLRAVDSGNTPLVISTFTFDTFNDTTHTQKTFSLSGTSGQQIKLEICMSTTPFSTLTITARSKSFISNGGNLTFWGKLKDNSFGVEFGLYIDLFEGGKYPMGSYLSQAFDTTISSPAWLSSGASATLNGNSLTAETQSSPDGSSWDSLVSWSTGSAPTSARKRHIRYKVTVSSTASTTGDATITDVALAARASTGTYISQAKEVGTSISSWGNFSANTSGDGTIAYSVRTATSAAMLDSASWVPVTDNTQITASTNPFIQVTSTFSITSATNVPTLENFTIFWNEGALTNTFGSIDKNHRLMWSLAEDGSSTNNATYIYDMRFASWLKYSAALDAPAKVGDYIYFGSQSVGDVFTYPSGSSDNGTAITSYWKSKDFIGSDPFSEKIWKSYSIVAKTESGSNFDLTYSTNMATGVLRNYSLTDTSGITLKRINTLFPNGTVSTFLNLKFGNDDSDSPFEIYSFRLDHDQRPWRVMP